MRDAVWCAIIPRACSSTPRSSTAAPAAASGSTSASVGARRGTRVPTASRARRSGRCRQTMRGARPRPSRRCGRGRRASGPTGAGRSTLGVHRGPTRRASGRVAPVWGGAAPRRPGHISARAPARGSAARGSRAPPPTTESPAAAWGVGRPGPRTSHSSCLRGRSDEARGAQGALAAGGAVAEERAGPGGLCTSLAHRRAQGWTEPFEERDISAVRARAGEPGGLEDAGQAAEHGIGEYRAEPRSADASLADVFVPVQMRAERSLGVVEMQDAEMARAVTVRSNAATAAATPRAPCVGPSPPRTDGPCRGRSRGAGAQRCPGSHAGPRTARRWCRRRCPRAAPSPGCCRAARFGSRARCAGARLPTTRPQHCRCV